MLVALALVAGGSFAAGVASGAAGQGRTAVTITFWDEGQRTPDPVVWTVPAGTICTEIYGGPQVARVVGLLEGRKVWARFTRTNGCQISRWNKLSPWLLPAGGVR